MGFFIFSLVTIQQPQLPEQVAINYFFDNIFEHDFSEYKVIEFVNQTTSNRYFGPWNGCQDFDQQLLKKILDTNPESTININSDKCPVKNKKYHKNSSRLKIRVHSRKVVDGLTYVYLTDYRKLRFVEHYYLTLNKQNSEVIKVCTVSEII